MKWVGAFAPYVPIIQTLLWCLLILVGVGAFYKQCGGILEAIRHRVEGGSSLKAGPVELGQDLQRLQRVNPAAAVAPPPGQTLAEPKGEDRWVDERNRIYKDFRGVFLVHVIKPSKEPGQLFDIFVYLKRHKSSDFSDVSFAEFFFGHYWGNEVFREVPKRGLIGVSTSAYGPFLCTCRITFKDGHVAEVYRYVDFEMGRAFGKQRAARS